MDPNFEYRTRDEKLQVVAYWWKEQSRLCCICGTIMLRYHRDASREPLRATIEHLIPKRDDGPNTVRNVRLAHAICNYALGSLWQINRDREAQGYPLFSEQEALANARERIRARQLGTPREAPAPAARKNLPIYPCSPWPRNRGRISYSTDPNVPTRSNRIAKPKYGYAQTQAFLQLSALRQHFWYRPVPEDQYDDPVAQLAYEMAAQPPVVRLDLFRSAVKK